MLKFKIHVNGQRVKGQRDGEGMLLTVLSPRLELADSVSCLLTEQQALKQLHQQSAGGVINQQFVLKIWAGSEIINEGGACCCCCWRFSGVEGVPIL